MFRTSGAFSSAAAVGHLGARGAGDVVEDCRLESTPEPGHFGDQVKDRGKGEREFSSQGRYEQTRSAPTVDLHRKRSVEFFALFMSLEAIEIL